MHCSENCSNNHDCNCPKKSCPYHGRCCDCIATHRAADQLPFCLFSDHPGVKSLKNFYLSLKKRFEEDTE